MRKSIHLAPAPGGEIVPSLVRPSRSGWQRGGAGWTRSTLPTLSSTAFTTLELRTLPLSLRYGRAPCLILYQTPLAVEPLLGTHECEDEEKGDEDDPTDDHLGCFTV